MGTPLGIPQFLCEERAQISDSERPPLLPRIGPAGDGESLRWSKSMVGTTLRLRPERP